MLLIGAAVYLAGGVFLLGRILQNVSGVRKAGGLMHINWKHLAIGLAILPVVVLFVAWIGFFNVGASSGHWKVTEWFLHFAMRSAVRTYALAVEVPRTSCRGMRSSRPPAISHAAAPSAMALPANRARRPRMRCCRSRPTLPARSANGPTPSSFASSSTACASPACRPGRRRQRDDEVWAMVAFLRELPTMEVQVYLARPRLWRQAAPPMPRDPRFRPCARPNARAATARTGSAAAQPRLCWPARARPIFWKPASLCRRTSPERRHGHGLPVAAVDPAFCRISPGISRR